MRKREGFVKRNLQLEFSKELIHELAKAGFDERYGARPLQRAIEQSLIAPLAKWMLEHSSIKNRTIYLDYTNELKIKI